MFGEDTGEVLAGAETAVERDPNDRDLCLGQATLRLLDPKTLQVVRRGLPGLLLEHLMETADGKADMPRNLGRKQWASEIAAHKGDGGGDGIILRCGSICFQQRDGIQQKLAHQGSEPGKLQRPGRLPGDPLNHGPKLGKPVEQPPVQVAAAVARPSAASRDPVEVRFAKRGIQGGFG